MFLLFLILWIVLNGQLTWEIFFIGCIISLCMFLFLCKFFEYSLKKDKRLFQMIPLMLFYVLILMKEIVKANIDTIQMVLTFREEIDPVIVKFKPQLKTQAAKVLLANSITLTPGTITVSVAEDEFVVHALDADFVRGLNDSEFIRVLKKMEAL